MSADNKTCHSNTVILLAALATTFVLERAVLALAGAWVPNREASTASGLQMRALAWQAPDWRRAVARTAAVGAALAFLVATTRFDGVDAVRVYVISAALLACYATDLLAYRVPDLVTLPAIFFALGWSAIAGQPELRSIGRRRSIGRGAVLLRRRR